MAYEEWLDRSQGDAAGEPLGPAQVISVADETLEVELEDGRRVEAEAAFSFPYQARVGDRLLVYAEGSRCYALGVLGGQGQHSLVLPGDVELRAIGGTLSLESDERIELSAPRVTVGADLLRTFAGTLSEQAGSAYRWIKGQLTVRAGESRRVVVGEDRSKSKQTVVLAEETVKIDGHQVHLGS